MSIEIIRLGIFLLLSLLQGRSLKCLQDNTSHIGDSDLLLCAVIRNELPRIPYFLEYYRALGVDHFLFIDNGSTDAFRLAVQSHSDISVWYTEKSYREANFGLHWANCLLRRYARGRWALLLDPDEFIVYPYSDRRKIKDLTDFLDAEARRSFFCVMIDMYSDTSLEQAVYAVGEDPLNVCPYFDRSGYRQEYKDLFRNVHVQGGVRERSFFSGNPRASPALNKTPLVKWKWFYSYVSSTHVILPSYLNLPHSKKHLCPTGALLHFKFLSLFRYKAEEELERKQHFGDSVEYRAYLDTIEHNDQSMLSTMSVKYRDWQQLEHLGLLQRGQWF